MWLMISVCFDIELNNWPLRMIFLYRASNKSSSNFVAHKIYLHQEFRVCISYSVYISFFFFLFIFSPQNSLIIPASSLYSGLVAWKYFLTRQCFYLNCWQFLFEYCLPVLTKNKDCPVFSLLLFIPWMMMVGLIWCNRICFLYDGNITDFIGIFITPTSVMLVVYIST